MARKERDLQEGRRNRTLFDRGSQNSQTPKVLLFFTLLAFFAPLLLLVSLPLRVCAKSNSRAKAAVLTSPVTRVSSLLGCSCLRWLVVRYFGIHRYMDNGQFDASGVSKHAFATYIFYKAELDSREVGFGEFLYDRATVSRDDLGDASKSILPRGLVFGTFWGKQPLGGSAREIPLVDGKAPPPPAREPPFSDGRMQQLLRSAEARGVSTLCASFLFGAADWIDCRPFIDIAREFECVNRPTDGAMLCIDRCGHQMMIDQPSGFVDAVCKLERGHTQGT